MMPIWMTAIFFATLLFTTRRIVRFSARPLAILIYLISLPIWSQTNVLQDQLNSKYKGKNLLLRSFYSSNNLAYDQNGVLRGADRQGSWTLAEVAIKDISVNAQGIDIVGDRLGILYTAGKSSLIKISKLRIHIDANTQAALDPIFPKIFVDPKENLRPLLPDSWKYFPAGTDRQSRFAAWETDLKKSQFPPVKPTDFPAGKLKAPRAVYAPDPKYTQEAASRHIEGMSVLSTVIDTTGGTRDVAIMQPLGMGLDEQAVIALKQWHFTPSTLDGQTVPVKVNIEINFRCCP